MGAGVITHLDLFSGIGGFSRAVEWLGGTTVGFVEWDAWNRRVLAKHWPEAHYHGDIKTLTADVIRGWGVRTNGVKLEQSEGQRSCSRRISSRTEAWKPAECNAHQGGHRAIDLITGGYPCQPFSVAGQRLGAEDDRHLWPEMRRVIDLCRPRFVLAENVAGHVTMGLDTVLSDLEADGYTCGAVVVPACAVNALHRRDRVWIIATLPDAERGGWGEQLRVDAAQGPLPASEWAQGALGTRSSGEDATMAHAESGTRIPAAHGGASGEGGAARMEAAGRGGGCDEPGADPTMADAEARGIRRGSAPGQAGQPALGSEGVGNAEVERVERQRAIRVGVCTEDGRQIVSERSGDDGRTVSGRQAPRTLGFWAPRISTGLGGQSSAGPSRGEVDDANDSEVRTDEELQGVRQADGAEAIQRATRRPSGVPTPPILQSDLFGDGAANGYGRGAQQPSEETSQGLLRDVWGDGNAPGASHRRGPQQQQPIEPDDLVSALSHDMALGAWEETVEATIGLPSLRDACRWVGVLPETPDSLQAVWRSLAHEEKMRVAVRACARKRWDDPDLIRAAWADGSWEFDLPRVVTTEPERRQKLQAGGNAIVPVLAYEILRVMLSEAAYVRWGTGD